MTRGYRDPPLRFAPGLAARAALALGLVLAAAPAAAESWQLFATATAAKVFFDRDSVRAEDGYLRYRVRIEYNELRTSNDGKVRFRTSVSDQVGQCREPKVAAASVALYDAEGALVSDTGRSPEQWKQAMTSVSVDGLQARLLQHACRLAGREEPPKSGSASASRTERPSPALG